MGAKRRAWRVLVGKRKRKRPLRSTRRKYEENIKMDLREIGWGRGIDWIQLAQGRDQ
jgi:hypothetical protein